MSDERKNKTKQNRIIKMEATECNKQRKHEKKQRLNVEGRLFSFVYILKETASGKIII